MRKYKYVVAYKGHYFSLMNAVNYKNFYRLINMKKPCSLIQTLELMDLYDIKYVVVDKIFKGVMKENEEFR